MFKKLKSIFFENNKDISSDSRSYRERRTDKEINSNNQSTESYGYGNSHQFMANFTGFRTMIEDFSKRIEEIEKNPKEAYLVNTELILRILGILENISISTERNTATLEKMNRHFSIKRGPADFSNEKRRAREVLAVLEKCGALTYEELRRELKPNVSYNRVTALVSEMIRDGVPLDKGGRPVRVSLGN